MDSSERRILNNRSSPIVKKPDIKCGILFQTASEDKKKTAFCTYTLTVSYFVLNFT